MGAGEVTVCGWWERFEGSGGNGLRGRGGNGLVDGLLRLLPPYLVAGRADQATLRALVEHRYAHPPHAEDLKAVREHLLPAFVALAEFSSEDENLDAEMRVYCAYSLPGVILLMGREAWSGDEDGLLRRCFLHLITGIRIQKKAAEGSQTIPSRNHAGTSLLSAGFNICGRTRDGSLRTTCRMQLRLGRR